MAGILYWIFAILLLGIVIILHELGHFQVARWTGIKVMSFGIGFGPKLWSHTGKDGVLYVVRLLPIGGYCRYYGEDEKVENDRDAFYRQPVWKRAASTIAGPLMNLLTAVLAFFVLYAFIGFPINIPAVGDVMPDSPAMEAGLLPGDKFVEVNGSEIKTVEDVQNQIAGAGASPVSVVVERGGARESITITPRVIDAEAGRPQIGIWFGKGNMRLGIAESARYAFTDTKGTVVAMFNFLKNLVTRGEGVGDMVGPVGTIQLVRQETETGGLTSYMAMLAMISVNLGFFNLLPIPGLDGSRLLFLAVEAVRRKRIDPNKEGLVHLVGIVLLLLLMLPVYVRDIIKLF